MNFDLAILSLIIAGGALGAIWLRDLVHSVLALALTFAGLAGVYLRLGAEFIAFSQVIVYIGAVAILALFVVILTRKNTRDTEDRFARERWVPMGVCGLLFTGLAAAAWSSSLRALPENAQATLTLQKLGKELMSHYILPLEVLGLLLTAALIGAAIMALADDREADPSDTTPGAHH